MSSRRAAKQRKRSSYQRKPSRDREGVSKIVSVLAIVVMIVAAAALLALYSFGSANGEKLEASFDMDVEEGRAPLTVRFTDTSVGGPTKWEWDLNGDGVIDSYAQNPTFTYDHPGLYSVRVTISNADDQSSLLRDELIKVTEVPPVAGFQAMRASGSSPWTVEFIDTSTGSVAGYRWDFGDGCISELSSPRHVYTSAGTYDVSLTVWNTGGESSARIDDLVHIVPNTEQINWTQWQRDAVHSGVLYYDSMPDAAGLLWSSDTGSAINSQPIVAGDRVFVLNSEGVVSMDRLSGELLWSAPVGTGFENGLIAYGDGKVFVANHFEGIIYALNESDGSIEWEYQTRSGERRAVGFASPITYYEGRIYVCERNYQSDKEKLLYCLDQDGDLIWSTPFDDSGVIWSGPVVVGDYIVCHTYLSGLFRSYHLSNGTMVDEISLKSGTSFAREDLGTMRSSCVYHSGYIYQTSENGQEVGYLFKVRFQDGSFIDEGWSTKIGFSTSTPVIYDGRIYVGHGEHGYTGSLLCLDDAEGQIIWRYDLPSAGVKSSPAVVVSGEELHILFTGNAQEGADEKLYCLDGDGKLRWSWNPPENSYILQGGTPSDGKVYFGTTSGYLYCVG